MTENKNNPFDFFDFTEEDVDAAQSIVAEAISTKNGKICICGHPVGRHSFVERSGTYACVGIKGNNCVCNENRPVIQVDDARPFLKKTIGHGELHALTQGIREALLAKTKIRRRYVDGVAANVEVHIPAQNIVWLIDQKCDFCGKEEKLSPCCVSDRGNLITLDTKRSRDMMIMKYNTKLLCRECRLNN